MQTSKQMSSELTLKYLQLPGMHRIDFSLVVQSAPAQMVAAKTHLKLGTNFDDTVLKRTLIESKLAIDCRDRT